MTAWRQDLHAHPELGFEEHRTSEFVAGKLAEFGCEVHRNIGKTGMVGVLRTGDGPSIGLRADMDALPIHEANDIPYRLQCIIGTQISGISDIRRRSAGVTMLRVRISRNAVWHASIE
jgi:metal-dependent amidase/aminoacylase/carboxypeptidase family protein